MVAPSSSMGFYDTFILCYMYTPPLVRLRGINPTFSNFCPAGSNKRVFSSRWFATKKLQRNQWHTWDTVFQGYSGLNKKAFDSDWRHAVISIQLHVGDFIVNEMWRPLFKDFPGKYAWVLQAFLVKKKFPAGIAYVLNFPTKSPFKTNWHLYSTVERNVTCNTGLPLPPPPPQVTLQVKDLTMIFSLRPKV